MLYGSTKRWNPESGNGNGISETERETETETETETEYGICERRFQAIDLKKKNISNDNKINKQIKKKAKMNKLAE